MIAIFLIARGKKEEKDDLAVFIAILASAGSTPSILATDALFS